MAASIEIINAHQKRHIRDIRTLFEAYERSINVDLCFQQFEEELATLPGDYRPPHGCLLMARKGTQPVGCVALRQFADGVSEMKRLYVDPACRGQGVGIKLIEKVIGRAVDLGYTYMRLDTLPSMTKAISLYESLGFEDIEAYRHNPVGGVRYMQLSLKEFVRAGA